MEATYPDWSVAVGMAWFGALYSSTVKFCVKQLVNVGDVTSTHCGIVEGFHLAVLPKASQTSGVEKDGANPFLLHWYVT
mgnify:CR=1 FL=1